MIPIAFTVEDPVTAESFIVEGSDGWLSFIAGYTKMAEPSREKDGWPVLEPAPGSDMSFLRTALARGILEPFGVSNNHGDGE